MNKDEVMRLAGLARIAISDKEAESLTREFESILNYVGEVKKVSKLGNSEARARHSASGALDTECLNRMREDKNPHESGIYSEKLLNEAPAREENYVKVKKIL